MSKSELMQIIAGEVKVCVKCPLWKGRRNAVPGEGSVNTSLAFVGEAPGYWEDVKGRPFVGTAGKVLDSLLEKISLPRESVFVTNVVKCRPPENRDPRPTEISACASSYLDRQICLLQPKLIVTLGRHSTAYILSKAGLGKVSSITEYRGRMYGAEFFNLKVSVLPMYHPASVLHNPKYRNELERDFRFLKIELRKRRII